jgi:hypothetical protein
MSENDIWHFFLDLRVWARILFSRLQKYWNDGADLTSRNRQDHGFLKAVILRVNEARDLGEFDRFQFYDHMKAYTAAPPDVLRIDQKHLRK